MGKYSETLMDHFLNPRNAGRLAEPDRVGQAGSRDRPPFMVLHVKMREKVVEDGQSMDVGRKLNSVVRLVPQDRRGRSMVGDGLTEKTALPRRREAGCSLRAGGEGQLILRLRELLLLGVLLGGVIVGVAVYRHVTGPSRAQEELRRLGGRECGGKLGRECRVVFEGKTITDKDMQRIVKLLNTGYIGRRAVINGPIDDEGVVHIAALPKLRSVCFIDCGITDKSFEYLSTCAALQHVMLCGTETTAEGVREFKARHPHCQVFWEEM